MAGSATNGIECNSARWSLAEHLQRGVEADWQRAVAAGLAHAQGERRSGESKRQVWDEVRPYVPAMCDRQAGSLLAANPGLARCYSNSTTAEWQELFQAAIVRLKQAVREIVLVLAVKNQSEEALECLAKELSTIKAWIDRSKGIAQPWVG